MYGYKQLERELVQFKTNSFIIGKSELNRNIYGILLGDKGKTSLIFGAIHAREYITAKLVMMLASDYASKKDAYRILFVPMANPDGVELVVDGIQSIGNADLPFLRQISTKTGFDNYKANALAVDLNVNFDAYWGMGKCNVRYPAQSDYIGEYPFSAAESRVLRDLTLLYDIQGSVCYHSKGEVIYHSLLSPDKSLYINQTAFANAFSNITGYVSLESYGSYGGYKDWFILTRNKPCVTIEVCDDSLSHPVRLSQIDKLYQQNKEVAILLGKMINDGY